MKKKIILLPLLVLSLTACDLNSLMGGGGNNNNEPASSRERSSLTPNDIAIKVADFVSVFPEVGDELDMDDYVDFDTGTDYKLEQFTFTSKNPDVISIENYHARCLKDGYAIIEVSGPGLYTPVEVSFYVGDISGNYTIDSTAYSGVVNLNITKGDDGYDFAFNVVPNGKKINKREVVAYSGSGTLQKNLSPFLPMEFEDAAPSSIEPVANYLIDLVGEENLGEFKDLADNVYGYMVADPDEGVIIKMRFNETFIDLIR